MARQSRLRHPPVEDGDAASTEFAAIEPRPLPAALLEEPWLFQFFQAVRLLQLTQPGRKPVGHFSEPAQEAVRLHVRQALGHPPSELSALTERPDGLPKLEVNFMGLSGPMGELPVFYTAYLRQRLRDRDSTAVDFLDIFNHRLLSLFYRAWERHRFTVPYERGPEGGITHYLLDLLGLGTPGLQDRQELGDESLVYYAGLLGQRPRSALALRQILEDYFDVPVEIIQFIGAWRKLDESTICVLDDDEMTAPSSTRLGLGAVAGDEVWDPQSIVRVRLGPLPLSRYLEFLPNGGAFPALRAICRFFAGQELDFEVQLVLRREDAPGVELGGEGAVAPQLGWITWVKSVPMGRDPDDTVYRLWEEENPSNGR